MDRPGRQGERDHELREDHGERCHDRAGSRPSGAYAGVYPAAGQKKDQRCICASASATVFRKSAGSIRYSSAAFFESSVVP